MSPISERLWLVGLMGAGKSTVGRAVARRAGTAFSDTDMMVESQTEMSVTDLFRAVGIAAFRDLERQAVSAAATGEGVIATGGGAVLDLSNRALMADSGVVVYLEARPSTLARRTGNDSSRPFLAGRDPLDVFEAMSAERGPLYEEVAHFVIVVDEMGQSQVVEAVEAVWNGS